MIVFYPTPTAYDNANAMSLSSGTCVPLMDSPRHRKWQAMYPGANIRRTLLLANAREQFKAGSLLLINSTLPAFLVVGCQADMTEPTLESMVETLSFMTLQGDILFFDDLCQSTPGAAQVADYLAKKFPHKLYRDIPHFTQEKRTA